MCLWKYSVFTRSSRVVLKVFLLFSPPPPPIRCWYHSLHYNWCWCWSHYPTNEIEMLSAETTGAWYGRRPDYNFFLFCCCSLSSGEDHLEKLSEMERILHQAQGEKMRMLEQQVSSSVKTNTVYFALFMNLFSQITVKPHFCGHPLEGPPIVNVAIFEMQ